MILNNHILEIQRIIQDVDSESEWVIGINCFENKNDFFHYFNQAESKHKTTNQSSSNSVKPDQYICYLFHQYQDLSVAVRDMIFLAEFLGIRQGEVGLDGRYKLLYLARTNRVLSTLENIADLEMGQCMWLPKTS